MDNRSAKKKVRKEKSDFGHQLVRGIWRIGKEIVRLKQPLVEKTVVITGGSPRHKLHTPFAAVHGYFKNWLQTGRLQVRTQICEDGVLHCSNGAPWSSAPLLRARNAARKRISTSFGHGGKEGKVCEGEPGPQREFATRKLLKNWPDTHLKISF